MEKKTTPNLRLASVNDLADKKADDLPRYVRVNRITDSGFVEFNFAIGSADLFVELILPQTAFDDFCKNNNAIFMTDEQSAMVDEEMQKWRYGDETIAARQLKHD